MPGLNQYDSLYPCLQNKLLPCSQGHCLNKTVLLSKADVPSGRNIEWQTLTFRRYWGTGLASFWRSQSGMWTCVLPAALGLWRCFVSVVIFFDFVLKQTIMWINVSSGACILQKPCPTAHSASVPATPRISSVLMPFRHFRLASLQNTESLHGPGPTWVSVTCLLSAESSLINAESRIQI